MGGLVSLAKRLFSGSPDEQNITNAEIERHHKMEQDGAETQRRFDELVNREAEARKAAEEARKQTEQLQKDLQRAEFYLSKGIQPEVWPTKEEFELAKGRIQYDPQKIHLGICGSSGSGKSSLVNAFRGLRNGTDHAAPTGTTETTMVITRYPDPREELPYSRLVWFDCPGAGTLTIPGWQYFNQQGLFIFDVIVLVYDTRFTQIDVSIIQNCERFKIPLLVVRSKADLHIQSIMRDSVRDENDDSDTDDLNKVQARQKLITTTRDDFEKNLKKAELTKRKVFIVSGDVVYSIITGKERKKKGTQTPPIDEAILIETILKFAYARRYDTQAPKESSMIVRLDNMFKEALALSWPSPHESNQHIGTNECNLLT